MSLINDALKRASRAHKKSTADGAGGAPLQPVETQTGGHSAMRLILIVVLLGCVGGLGWTAYKLWFGKPTAQAAVGGTNAAAKKPGVTTTNVSTAKKASDALTKPLAKASELADKLKTIQQTDTTVTAPEPAPLQPKPAEPKVLAPEPQPAVAAAVKQPVNIAKVESSTPVSAVTAEPPKPVDLSTLKLQAIFYRLKKPSVIINGKTVYVGDTIEGARLTGVERQSATVEAGGATRTLKIGE